MTIAIILGFLVCVFAFAYEGKVKAYLKINEEPEISLPQNLYQFDSENSIYVLLGDAAIARLDADGMTTSGKDAWREKVKAVTRADERIKTYATKLKSMRVANEKPIKVRYD